MSIQERLASTSIAMDLLSINKGKKGDSVSTEDFLKSAEKIHEYLTKDTSAAEDLFSSMN